MKISWKYAYVLGFFTFISLSTTGCDAQTAEAGGDSQKPVITINQLKLTLQDVREELSVRKLSPYHTESITSDEPLWLSELIDRELLVQKAQELGLDRKEEFMRTIERFWKEALIKTLVQKKAEDIGRQTKVYAPEIEKKYQDWVAETGQKSETLNQVRDELKRLVREEKESAAMETWLSNLRKEAKVHVDNEALAKVRAA